MDIKNLCENIFQNFISESTKMDSRLLSKKVNRIAFVAENFYSYPESYVLPMLIKNTFLWHDFTVEDWLQVFFKIKDNEIAWYTCLIFLYKYIGVDSISFFKNQENINDNIKVKVVDYFRERSSLLRMDFMGKRYVADSQSFIELINNYRKGLIAQGLMEALS